jgi:hypothetical protein
MLAAVASPPDWLPSDIKGWRMLRNAVEALGHDGIVDWAGVGGPGDAGMEILVQLVHRCGRQWPGMFWYPVDERFLVLDTVRELGFDMLAQLVRCRAVLLTQSVLVGDAATLGSCFLHHPRHPDAVRRITQRHHERLAPTTTGKAVLNAGTWNPFFLDVVWRHADGSVHELLSHDELSEEGRLLSHCVGSYGYDCASGQVRIYGLRDLWGRSVSTAMLALDSRGHLAVVQHSAMGNRRPSGRASRMLADFVSHCELPGTTATDVLQPPEKRRAPDADSVKVGALLEMAMGAQWHDADVMAVRWERWRALLDVDDVPLLAMKAHFARWPAPWLPPCFQKAVFASAAVTG